MANQPSFEKARSRIAQVFRFLQELHRVRTPPKLGMDDYDWKLKLENLSNFPTVKVGNVSDTENGDQTEFLLKVSRPKETACPDHPQILEGWILSGWKDVESEVTFLASRNFSEAAGQTRTEKFEDDHGRLAAFEEWGIRRSKWAEAEKPIRAAGAVYANLFRLLGEIERDSEKYQLFLGEGILSWLAPVGRVLHPLLLMRVNLEFNSSVPEFTITASDHDIELNDALLRFCDVDSKALLRCKQRVAEGQPHPLSANGSSAALEYAAQSLFTDGQFFKDESKAKGITTPHIFSQPTFFLGNRNQGFVDALDSYLTHLPSLIELPQALTRVVGVDLNEEFAGETDRNSDVNGGGSPSVVDKLLTKPSNQEQERIIDQLSEVGTVLVQGPPGTGKSHTIANLVGHLLAQNKTILITSNKSKALRVVREKVVDSLKPLCVSVLDNDQESKKQLEESILGIVNYLSRNDAGKLRGDLKHLEDRREMLKARSKEILRQLKEARRGEYTDLIVSGAGTPPSRAARKLAEFRGIHDWIPLPVKHGSEVPLTSAELDELYGLSASISPVEEGIFSDELVDIGKFPTPVDFFDFVGERSSLSQAAEAYSPNDWAHLNADVKSLEKLASSLEESFVLFDNQSAWQTECVEVGRFGGAGAEIWFKLVAYVEATAAKIAEYQALIIESGPDIKLTSTSAVDALGKIEEIIQHLKAGGKLNFVSMVFKSDWKELIASCSVANRPPTSLHHFEAIHALISVSVLRSSLTDRWNRQLQSIGQATEVFESEPERALAQKLERIKTALQWYPQNWTSLQSELEANGIRLGDILIASRIPDGKYAEITSLVASAKRLRSLLQMRIAQIRLENFQSTEKIWHSELSRFGASSPSFELVLKLQSCIERGDTSLYKSTWQRLSELHTLRKIFDRRIDLLKRLEACAPRWAASVKARVEPHDTSRVPGEIGHAWLNAQWSSQLNERAAADIDQLQADLSLTKKELQDVTSQYVEALAWLRQIERTGLAEQQALMGWLGTQKRITRGGKGVRDDKLRAEAKKLLKQCKSAVPVWIMPESRALEAFELGKTHFDVVILDEASQSDVTALAVLALGKQVIVVGDHEQVSPSAAGVKLAPVQALIDEILTDIPNNQLYDGRLSLYDIARQSFGGTIRLIEHFRCVPDIIQFSNDLSYRGEIKPLREASDSPFSDHVISHRIEDGTSDGKINEAEAKEIASLVIAMTEAPEYQESSIGVISLRGQMQAPYIDAILRKHLSSVVFEKHGILCGTASQFQGDERNVILMSMVDSCESPPLAMQQSEEYQRSFNVAASRAMDQAWVVHSLNPQTDLKAGDIRLRLIRHMENPAASRNQLLANERKVESEFEKRVLGDLTRAGFRLVPQWPVGAYRIDLVAVGSSSKIAIECDGDRYHPPEKLADDLDRQMILERLGWTFIRIRGSEYFRNPEQAISKVVKRLDDNGIERLGNVATPVLNLAKSDLRQNILRRAEEIRQEWLQNGSEVSSTQMTDAPTRRPRTRFAKNDIKFGVAASDDGSETS